MGRLTQKNTACGTIASETNGIQGTGATNARVCHMGLGTSHKDRHSDNKARKRSAARFVTGDYRRTSSVSDRCTNLVWNSLYTRRRIRDATIFFNSPRTNAHQLAFHLITTADACTRRLHKHKLRTLPATCTPYQHSFYVRCIPLWVAFTEKAVNASTAEVEYVHNEL